MDSLFDQSGTEPDRNDLDESEYESMTVDEAWTKFSAITALSNSKQNEKRLKDIRKYDFIRDVAAE